jgi:HupE / UreJ protein
MFGLFARYDPRRAMPAAVLAWCLLAAFPGTVSAHTPETSYARITIKSNTVEFKLSYDIAGTLKMARLNTDEGRLTREEFLAGAPKIEAYLRQHVFPEINSQEVEFGRMRPAAWPADAGEAIPRKEFQQRLLTFVFDTSVAADIEDVAITFDFFADLGERHTVLGLFACGKDEQDVIFDRLEPDYLYDTKVGPNGDDQVFAFTGQGPDKPEVAFNASLAGQMLAFVKLGVHHIFIGYDHLLFLLGLMIVSRFWDLLKIVTSFTVAHTITLILATLHVVNISGRFVEIAIALTIMYVAIENLWIKEARNRWRLTFAFGLVHGFGFANVLQGMELPARGLVRCLLSFNVGVEIGQLAIVLVAFPILVWLSKRAWNSKAQFGVSLLILVAGFGWFLQRAFGFGYMPF